MDKTLKIALILTAVDKMSGVIAKSVDASNKKIAAMQSKSSQSFSKGAAFGGMALASAALLAPAISNFASLEEAQLRLKSNMMQDGGILDDKMYGKMSSLAVTLGNELKGNSADFFNMQNKLLQLGVTQQSILDGAGKSAAYLAIATNDAYENSAEVVAKLKAATGVQDKDLNKFIDTIARTYNLGVKTDEMSYAFARSAGALKTMNLQGLESSKSISTLYAMLIKTGQSGETIGTGMTSVFAAAMDNKKMKAFNDSLAQYGMQVDLVDSKKGQFKGVENMMKQFDNLNKLNPQQLSNAVAAWLGPGADAGFVKILSNAGVKGYNEMVSKMANQATLDKKVGIIGGGISQKWEAAMGTMENAFASFGSAIAPTIVTIANGLNAIFSRMQSFAETHPTIAKFIGLAIAAAAATFALVSAFNFIKGSILAVRVAMMALRVTMLANPVTAIMIGIALIAMLIIANWDKIKAFFIRLWAGIKAIFSATWAWLKAMFFKYHPLGLVIRHWDKISAFFSGLWQKVKAIFKAHVDFVLGLGGTFFNAGKNIVKSLWEGMKSLAHKPIEMISNMTKKIRAFLPFSPAKEGALRDIHKIKLVETIAASIKVQPAMQAMQRVTNAMFNAGSPQGGLQPAYANGSGGSMTVNLHFNGVSGDIVAQIKSKQRQIIGVLQEAERQMNRKKF